MNENSRKEFVFTIAAISFTFLAILASLTRCWEPGGESWSYWYFARVFAESGKFVVVERGPLYILYLNLFMYFPYPYSVIAEYVVTTSLAVLALIFFSRLYLGDFLSIFAAILWLPFMQSAEPPVQKLALACCLVAVLVRRKSDQRSNILTAYSLMFLAYLFRQTYVIVIVTFLLYDFVSLVMTRSRAQILALIRPRLSSDWPLIFVLAFLAVVLVNQSTHPFNNTWFTSTQWFPSDGKTMLRGGALQGLNWAYIIDKYGSFYGHDFYFTNVEAFGSAKSLFGAINSNPEYFVKYLASNVKGIVAVATQGTLPQGYGIVRLILFIGIVVGALFGTQDRTSQIFIVGCLGMLMTSVMHFPIRRHLFPIIPIFIVAASFYGEKISARLASRFVAS